MTRNDHSLIFELFGDISRTGTGDFDPCFGKDGTGGDDEGDVERVKESGGDGSWGGHVVGETRDGGELRRFFEGLWREGVSQYSQFEYAVAGKTQFGLYYSLPKYQST